MISLSIYIEEHSMKISKLIAEKISQLPKLPGCYIYRNNVNQVIYVGKALVLANRVKSYFQNFDKHDIKTKQLVSKIVDLEWIVTQSELEAYILETNLIRKYKPKYNIAKKDDKNYLWLMIDKSESFPRPQIVREKKIKNAIYYGPFASTLPIKRILKELRKIFPYRTCTRKIVEITNTNKDGSKSITIKSNDPKPCLYYFLNLCDAPCAGFISSKKYKNNINNISKFFSTKKNTIKEKLEFDMKKQASKKNYEQAAKLRDKIKDLDAISQRVFVEKNTDEYVYKRDFSQKSIEALQELINFLNIDKLKIKDNFKIECFDISNIQGTNAVASMVVFVDGIANKNLYRKFKIKTKDTPDDFHMIREVILRRFQKLNSKDDSYNTLPDLLIVDGGKGQLSSAYSVLNSLNMLDKLTVIGLAKKYETIIKIDFSEHRLKTGSESRFLMQRIRDESHRFAINYHRKLRSLEQNKSILVEIPGVGKVTKLKLLQAFGSIEKIKKASKQELFEIIKNKNTIDNLIKIL
jgi:excinuclease ABC subunit C